MKKVVLILLVVFSVTVIHAYTWIPFCPDTIHANNICFGVGSWKGVICSPNGMYLFEDDVQEWAFYTYGGLPVTGAAWLDGFKILVVMGNGSYSDGVYTFDLQTHQFEDVEWIVNPNFMLVVSVPDGQSNQFTDEYYIGSQFGGMYKSVDGLTWSQVPYFTGKSCSAMDCFENHLVVSEVSNIYNIHWSDDYGVTWQEAAAGAPILTDLKFSYEGDLFGIFPDYSNSSGLFKSEDFGNTWQVDFWSDNMSAVGYDAMGTIFVGWKSSAGGNEGVALYNPAAPPPGLTFMNNGLASTNINKILLNPTMSSIAIFCCTDAGVYMCNDYMVGMPDHVSKEPVISIFPNPVKDKATISINLPKQNHRTIKMEVLNSQGHNVDEILVEKEASSDIHINWSKGNLPAGVYYLLVPTKNKTITKKFIVL